MDQLPYYSSPPKMNKMKAGCLALPVAAFYIGLFVLLVHLHAGIGSPQAAGRGAASAQATRTPIRLSSSTATPTAMPTQAPAQQLTQTPTPPQPPSHQVTYDFNASGGGPVYSPPANFCATHLCVSTFQRDNRGYVVQCADGHYSHAGGLRGACSRNGGVAHILYMH